MSTASPIWRPASIIFEGPSESCVIDGKALGWTNCSPASVAMGISKSSRHTHNPDDCTLRRLTGDTTGGTTLSQFEAITRRYGVEMEVRTGGRACTPVYAAGQLHDGRGFALQGDAGQLVGTRFRSTAGRVNHCVWANEGRGWHADPNGHLIPSEVLVYDPAADGKLSSFGRRARGPAWWPWGLVLQFASHLHPWGEGDNRTLGPGKFYAALFPDTEPHVHLRYAGSERTTPMPRALTIHPPTAGKRQNVRKGPSTRYAVVATMAAGARFTAYQQNTHGQLLEGSRLWYGDHNGTRWVHSSGLR